MINARLFDWYGIDIKKNLNIQYVCPKPFDTILIDKQGSCYLCECTSWLPQSVGNLHKQSIENILNSKITKELHNSVTDGSYRYCNNKQCTWLLSKDFRYFKKQAPVNQIKNIRLAIDDSCNLRCPSCRKEMIFIKDGKEFEHRIKLADNINNWLHSVKHSVKVHIGSDGDPFASNIYRHFMMYTPVNNNIKYSLLTNGLLFKEFSKKIPHIIENLEQLGISIDGASKETYESLRLGGSWIKINENLEFISNLKKKHNFVFRLHFVVQKGNYHEMEKIIELGKKYNVDRVWLNRIEDWNVMKNFQKQNIFQTVDYKKYLDRVINIIEKQKDKFVECPSLINEWALYKNRN